VLVALTCLSYGSTTLVTTVPEALALAKASHSEGRLREAEQIYRAVLQADSGNLEALYLLGVACHVLGKPIDAIASLEQAARLRPNFAEAHNYLGLVLAQQGRLDDAAVCYRRIVALDPNCAEGHNNLAAICQEQRKFAEAISHYQRAVEISPNYAYAHNNLGGVLAKENRFDEAMACFRRALELAPELAEAHYNMGLALEKLNRSEEAIACIRQALEFKPCFAAAHNSLGQALAEQRNTDDAIACFRQALAIEPDNSQATSNLVAALASRNRLREPKAWHRQADLFAGLQAAEKQVHSQNGEDGVVEALFAELKTTNRFFVEFGCDDGRECNAAYLLEQGWNGLLMDCEEVSNPNCPVHQEFITAENINDLFGKHQVPAEFDLLSIDIDGNDFWVWKQITSRPRVVVIEYNGTIPPSERRTIAYDSAFRWSGTDYIGASLLALKELGQRKGYTLVYCERTGTNAFFVADELLPEGFEPPRIEEIYRVPNMFNKGVRHPRDTTRTMIDPFADLSE